MVLAVEGKNLLEFRNNFHNFRSSIKFSMNFYEFKLALVRLKLIDILDTRYIYFIFLEPRID
jgi:fatty-acid desaturase